MNLLKSFGVSPAIVGILLLLVSHYSVYSLGSYYTKQSIEAAQMVKRQKALETDAEMVVKSALAKLDLEIKIKDLDTYVRQLEDGNRECLSGADVGRLRDLWGKTDATP